MFGLVIGGGETHRVEGRGGEVGWGGVGVHLFDGNGGDSPPPPARGRILAILTEKTQP